MMFFQNLQLYKANLFLGHSLSDNRIENSELHVSYVEMVVMLLLRRIFICYPAQICGSFSAQAGVQGHIKMHHAHTNIIGLGDSSVWKVPSLSRTVYLFVAPLAVPVITPLVALGKKD